MPVNNHDRVPVTRALLDYDEAQRYLGGISRSTIKALVARGSIRSITIGRRRLIGVSALDAFIAERAAATAATESYDAA